MTDPTFICDICKQEKLLLEDCAGTCVQCMAEFGDIDCENALKIPVRLVDTSVYHQLNGVVAGKGSKIKHGFEVFKIYKQNMQYLDKNSMGKKELELLKQLSIYYGNGESL